MPVSNLSLILSNILANCEKILGTTTQQIPITSTINDENRSVNFVNHSEFIKKRDSKVDRKKVVLSGIVTLLLLFGLTIGLVMALTRGWSKQEAESSTTTSTNIPETSSQTFPVLSSSSTESSTTSKITTTLVPGKFKYFTRKDWGTTTMRGQRNLETPVNKIILMDTKTESCESDDACKQFVKARQIATYTTYFMGFSVNDIRENFLIAADGTVFEGRGFDREGQHTYDYASTSYNNLAIGVSFIGNYSDFELSSKQEESFKKFVEQYVNAGKIISNHRIYYVDQFKYVSTQEQTNDKLFDKTKSFARWKESKVNQIII